MYALSFHFLFVCRVSRQFLEDYGLLSDKLRDKLLPGSGKICGNLTDAKNVQTSPGSPESLNDYSTSASSSGPLAFYAVQASRMDIKFRLEASTIEGWKDTRLRFVVTSYLAPSAAGTCQKGYFSCGAASSGPRAGACVSQVLLCNGVPNCGFRGGVPGLDEANCPAGELHVSAGWGELANAIE